jgi:16S rRNA processing protein RimM
VVIGSHGVEGEMKLRLTTDDPEHLLKVKRVYLGSAESATRVRGMRFHNGLALVRLAGIETPERARELTGTPIRIAGKDARPLAPGEYYLYQVVGLSVRNEVGEEIGTVTDVMETGANEVFVVTPRAGGEPVLIPSLADVVLDLQPDAGFMVVRPLVFYGEE